LLRSLLFEGSAIVLQDFISIPSFIISSTARVNNFWTRKKYHTGIQTGTMIKAFFPIQSKTIKKAGLAFSASIQSIFYNCKSPILNERSLEETKRTVFDNRRHALRECQDGHNEGNSC